ncbi:c-type cytochrome [Peredibacter sp. HCB2-198]|uniref:c-type cytochrome n=1 Tax=Peredibacter sp. HCB2-198 TaxID=3383025 RepID=UPI0038B48E48
MNWLSDVSTFSTSLDKYMLFITVVCGAVTLIILSFIALFCFKYHASKVTNEVKALTNRTLEAILIIFTLSFFMYFFYRATNIYQAQVTPQKADYEIFVYAKQWMWKFHHPNGFTEVNSLHLPKNKRINFVMISEDVIHSLFLPDFRVKQDLLPEVYTTMSIHPLKLGTFPLFCTEYCGTDHALMKGRINIIEDEDYKRLIHQPNGTGGRDLFVKNDCLTCHNEGSKLAPSLVSLKRSDEELRRSILYPHTEKVKGFEAIMPSYKDTLSEGEVHSLIQYIKSMRKIDEKLL